MKQFLIILIAALNISFSIMFSMEQSSTQRECIRAPLQRIFGGSPSWRDLPAKLTLLHKDEPITDELLWAINPEWKEIKEAFTTKQKNSLLRHAVYAHYNARSQECRCLIALIVCAGANPDKTEGLSGYRNNALFNTALHGDTFLVQYLLQKGANPNHQYPGREAHCLIKNANRPAIIQLLIEHGIEIPSGMLESCCNKFDAYAIPRLQIFIDKGIQAEPNSSGNNALQILTVDKYRDKNERLEMARMLLKTNINVANQNKDGNTVLHLEAKTNHKMDKIKVLDLTTLIINHYLQRHKGFLYFLAFLRRDHSTFYHQTRDVRKRYFQESASYMKELHHLLCLKNNEGDTAYDLWKIEELNPATYMP